MLLYPICQLKISIFADIKKRQSILKKMNVAIVKYNAGNIYSVVNALKRLGITPELTDDAERLSKADRVLFFRDKEKPVVRWLTCVRGDWTV